MSINQYSENGKEYYTVYFNIMGKKNRKLRLQKRIRRIETLKEAIKLEKKLIAELTLKMNKLEGKGLNWEGVIERWHISAKSGVLGERVAGPSYYKDQLYRLSFTKNWHNKIASDITKSDVRNLFFKLKSLGFSLSSIKRVKSSISMIYTWGVEEGYITNQVNPTFGVKLETEVETVPKILTLDEVKLLLRKSKELNHSWYHIWSFALLTGMRSGELQALRWSDIELDKKIIRVSRSIEGRQRIEKSTKSGYWRTVPISSDLQSIIIELKCNKRDSDDFVLPRRAGWASGYASKILRDFLTEIGIQKDIVFHTLRACFATHLLASGAEAAKVMQIGGWKDFKTFQIYIRLAGVSVKGVTDSLNLLPKFNKDNIINFNSK